MSKDPHHKAPLMVLKRIDQRSGPIDLEPGKPHQLADLLDQAASPADLKAPPFAICRMARRPDGSYLPDPVEWGEWVPLNDEWLTKLGMKTSRRTIYRLAHNGYLKIRKKSPHCIEINLASLVDHLRAVTEDPDFWGRPANDGTHRTRKEAYDTDTLW